MHGSWNLAVAMADGGGCRHNNQLFADDRLLCMAIRTGADLCKWWHRVGDGHGGMIEECRDG